MWSAANSAFHNRGVSSTARDAGCSPVQGGTPTPGRFKEGHPPRGRFKEGHPPRSFKEGGSRRDTHPGTVQGGDTHPRGGSRRGTHRGKGRFKERFKEGHPPEARRDTRPWGGAGRERGARLQRGFRDTHSTRAFGSKGPGSGGLRRQSGIGERSSVVFRRGLESCPTNSARSIRRVKRHQKLTPWRHEN